MCLLTALLQQREFRVSPAILKTFYSGAIESLLTQCISVWYGNASNQDIYLKRCKSRAAKIIKDSNHRLFILLPSGKRFRSMMAKTVRLGRSFFHQAPKLKLCLITFTRLNLINCKTFTILHHPHCCYVYIPGATCLHIPLVHSCLYYYLLSPQYTVLHILFYCTFYSLFCLIII